VVPVTTLRGQRSGTNGRRGSSSRVTMPSIENCSTLSGRQDGKRTLGLALWVGTVVGLGSFVAGPVIASVACGLCSAALTVAARVLLPLWQLVRTMTGSWGSA